MITIDRPKGGAVVFKVLVLFDKNLAGAADGQAGTVA